MKGVQRNPNRQKSAGGVLLPQTGLSTGEPYEYLRSIIDED
jgi:hypothetical protein